MPRGSPSRAETRAHPHRARASGLASSAGSASAPSEHELHALVGCDEAEALVEAVRPRAELVAGELDAEATLAARLVDRPAHHRFADAAAAERGLDDDVLDHRDAAP